MKRPSRRRILLRHCKYMKMMRARIVNGLNIKLLCVFYNFYNLLVTIAMIICRCWRRFHKRTSLSARGVCTIISLLCIAPSNSSVRTSLIEHPSPMAMWTPGQVLIPVLVFPSAPTPRTIWSESSIFKTWCSSSLTNKRYARCTLL